MNSARGATEGSTTGAAGSFKWHAAAARRTVIASFDFLMFGTIGQLRGASVSPS
jgi:hypothetical protein